jgi:16S rRNA (cytosine1402-N4)-methyltransferase
MATGANERGASVYHVPVLRDEVLDGLALAPGKRVVDATLGGGGHSVAMVERIAPNGVLLGLDQDTDALQAAQTKLANVADVTVRTRQTNFEQIADAVKAEGWQTVDAVLMDLGVSSFQLDTAGRGFAFRYNGPLDMRMNASGDDETAAELLNRLPEAEIARILFEFGEESRSRRIASEIVNRRKVKPLATTEDLVDAVRGAMPHGTRPGQIHPATKTFQAVRIAVNRELDVLTAGLRGAVSVLASGGRIAVISYHSLEDRIVKNVFAELSGKRVESDLPSPTPLPDPVLTVVTKKPIAPTDEETRVNVRARSAKLRIAEKL